MTVTTNQDNSEVPLRPRPVILLLLDGWGIAPPGEANAIAAAKTPTFFKLIKEYPIGVLTTGAKTLNARYLTIGTGQNLNAEEGEISVTFSKTIAAAGLKQIKVTETERLAALTHFFNGQSEAKADQEDWLIVSSETGDHSVKPSLALKRLARTLLKIIATDSHDLIVAAWPTADLVAASGDFNAAKKSIEAVDKDLKKIVEAVLAKDGVLIISAALGNAERMKNLATELVDKEMTNNPVPLVIVGPDFKGKTIGLADALNTDLSLLSPAGSLADLAPTILQIVKISKPVEMTGESVIK